MRLFTRITLFLLLLIPALSSFAGPKRYRVEAVQRIHNGNTLAVDLFVVKLLGDDFGLGSANFNLRVREDDIDLERVELDATFRSPFSFDTRPNDYYGLNIGKNNDYFVVNVASITAAPGKGELINTSRKQIATVLIPITNLAGYNRLDWFLEPMGVVDFETDASIKADGEFVVLNPELYFTPQNALPVELLSFSGRWTNKATNSVDLKWNTSTALRADKFVVERSFDSRAYAAVGTVQQNTTGTGTSTTTLAYSFNDPLVPREAGDVVYYRLNIHEPDGSTRYSNVVELHRLTPGNQYSLYPNPVRKGDYVYILSSRDNVQDFKIQIIDATGKVVYQCPRPQTPGSELKINTYPFATGNYTVQIENAGQEAALRFVVQ